MGCDEPSLTTVTFEAQSGTAPSPAGKGVTVGAVYGTLATTMRDGYTFDGWWTGADGTGSKVTAETQVTVADNHTLYAKWMALVTVSNVTAAQRPGTKLVDISYDVLNTETNSVKVSLAVSNGTSTVNCSSVSGDVGAGVATGTRRTIIWDAGADWNGNIATMGFTVTVADSVAGVPGIPLGGDSTATSWETVNERWVKNTYADGAVTMSDRNTGLMWVFDASANGSATWQNAMAYCNNLTYAGHSDWLLPDRGQLPPMYGQRTQFGNVQADYYWTSTQNGNSEYAYYSAMQYGGDATWYDHMYNAHWVWPCRLEPEAIAVSGSASALTDTRDYTLAVASAQGGNPVPGIGTHTNAWRATVTPSVDALAGNYTCTGWTGTGSIPATGSTNTTGPITLTTVVSSIAWQWVAHAHHVTLHPGDHGDFPGANSGASYMTNIAHGAVFTPPIPVADEGWIFSDWDPPIPATITDEIVATAQYVEEFTVTLHPGDHGDFPGANSGASYMTNIAHGAVFNPPKPAPEEGWIFIGWNPPFLATITGDVIATARYAEELPGSGTETDPYRISSEADFEAFGSAPVYWGRGLHTRLETSLDFDPNKPEGRVFSTALVAPDAISDNAQFDGTPFAGNFNGNGYTISNITIISPAEGHDYLGLFGSIDPSGVVRDISMENVDINGEQWILLNDGWGSTWNVRVGSVSGHNRGLLSNCHANGKIIVKMGVNIGGVCGENDQGIISNCTANVSVAGGGYTIYTGGSSCLGGLCGFNKYGSISRCFATGNVSTGAHGCEIGGFCGWNYNGGNGLISHCYATGDVSGGWGDAGGFIGFNRNRIENCYATGDVSAGQNIGGFCGYNWWGTIVNSYSTGAASGKNQGGFCGINREATIINSFWDTETSDLSSSAGGVGKTTGEMQDSSTFLNAGWDFVRETTNGDKDVWSTIGDYPVLAWTTKKRLALYSEYGPNSPITESLSYYWGDEVSLLMNSPDTHGGVRYDCTGWSGTGSVPTIGTGTNCNFTITNESSIVWNWITNYWLEATATAGEGQVTGGDAWVPGGTEVTLTASAEVGYRFDHWLLDGQPVGGTANVLAVQMDAPHQLTAHFVTLDLPEALDSRDLVWTNGGSVAWTPQISVTHDGIDAAQSGTIGDKQTTWLETSVIGGGTLSFWWKVSSEKDYDMLSLYVDGSLLHEISGETEWLFVSVPVAGDGSHVVRWEYSKDKNESAGDDCGWLDQVVWTPERSGFALWAQECGLTGDAATLFGQINSASSLPYGLEYAFGDNLASDEPLLKIRVINGRPVVDVATQDPATLEHVALRVVGTTDLDSGVWSLPIRPVANPDGKPVNRDWLELSGVSPKRAYFKIVAGLRSADAPGSFAYWMAERDLSGDPAELFGQLNPESGVPNGFEYVFGANLMPDKSLLTIRFFNGHPVVETPMQDAATLPYVDLRVLGSDNLIDWTLPVVPSSDTTGKPSDRAWHEPEGALPERAFFKLEAELK